MPERRVSACLASRLVSIGSVDSLSCHAKRSAHTPVFLMDNSWFWLFTGESGDLGADFGLDGSLENEDESRLKSGTFG